MGGNNLEKNQKGHCYSYFCFYSSNPLLFRNIKLHNYPQFYFPTPLLLSLPFIETTFYFSTTLSPTFPFPFSNPNNQSFKTQTNSPCRAATWWLDRVESQVQLGMLLTRIDPTEFAVKPMTHRPGPGLLSFFFSSGYSRNNVVSIRIHFNFRNTIGLPFLLASHPLLPSFHCGVVLSPPCQTHSVQIRK